MADTVADLALKAAKQGLPHEAFLYELVQGECTQREERRTARLLHKSGRPLEKPFRPRELDGFPPVLRQQVERRRQGAFLDEASNVVAVGQPGPGKSHLLAALAHELILQGHAVLWTPTALLVQRWLAAKRDLRRPQALAQFERYAWVSRDDIGYVPHDRDEREGRLTLLAERYERRSVGSTTNLVFSDWTRSFQDPLTTLAAIDRVGHHAVILDRMGMASYRAKEAGQHQPPRGQEAEGVLPCVTVPVPVPRPWERASTPASPAGRHAGLPAPTTARRGAGSAPIASAASTPRRGSGLPGRRISSAASGSSPRRSRNARRAASTPSASVAVPTATAAAGPWGWVGLAPTVTNRF